MFRTWAFPLAAWPPGQAVNDILLLDASYQGLVAHLQLNTSKVSKTCHPSSVEISPTMPSSIEQVLCLLFLHRGLHWRRLVAATSVSVYSLGDGDCWAKDTRGTKKFKQFFFVRDSITESHEPVEGNCSVHCPTGSPSYSRRCCTPRSWGSITTLNKDCQWYATQSQCCTSLAW